jgi:hypothetical protein
MNKVRLIQGKGDWEATPPTGASDSDLHAFDNDVVLYGGVLSVSGGHALVQESDTPGMSVKVNPGIIYVFNDDWAPASAQIKFYHVVREEVTSGIAISSNPSGSTRYDVVCQAIDKVTTPNDDGSNVVPIEVVEGTPGDSLQDVIDALPDYHLPLAGIEVVNGASSITDSDIVDLRSQIQLDPAILSAPIQELAYASSINLDLSYGTNKFQINNPSGSMTIGFSFPAGMPIYVVVANPDSETITWTGVKWPDGGDVPDPTAEDYDTYLFMTLPNGDILGYAVGSEFA